MNPKGKILIADDEAALRKTLARILQNAGYEVTTAENGLQVLSFVENTAFDLIFLDIRMPEMSGLEVLDALHSRSPNLNVVLFTAQPDLSSALEALRRGAVDYLLKPLKPDDLLEKTRSILEKQKKEQKKRQLQAQIEALQAELKHLDEPGIVPEKPLRKGSSPERYLKNGFLILDLHARRLTVDEKTVPLPPTAFDYLLVLARHAPEVVDYQTLVVEAQGFQTDMLEAKELTKWHIHELRQAIEKNTQRSDFLITVRGAGYRLVTD